MAAWRNVGVGAWAAILNLKGAYVFDCERVTAGALEDLRTAHPDAEIQR